MALCSGYLFKKGSNSEEKLHWFGFFAVRRSRESGHLVSLVCPLASEDIHVSSEALRGLLHKWNAATLIWREVPAFHFLV